MTCRCKKNQRELVLYRTASELPPRLQAVVRNCPACRAFFQRSCDVAALVGLKRYERPPAAAADRARTAIRLALSEYESGRTAEDAAPAGWWAETWPALRLSTAAAFVALLGLHLFSGSSLTSLPSEDLSLLDATPSTMSQSSQTGDHELNPEFPLSLLSNWVPRVRQDGPYRFVGSGY